VVLWTIMLIHLILLACTGPASPPETGSPAETGSPPETGSPAEPPDGAPLNELRQLQQSLNTTDLAISVSEAPEEIPIGGTFSYVLAIANRGPNPASQVEVVNTLAPGVAFVRVPERCREERQAAVTCELGELLAGETRRLTMTVLVTESVERVSGVEIVSNSASVTNRAGPDADPNNNSSTFETRVVRW
jgi:uncharacterized repeat protein (TIGR01451 family)